MAEARLSVVRATLLYAAPTWAASFVIAISFDRERDGPGSKPAVGVGTPDPPPVLSGEGTP